MVAVASSPGSVGGGIGIAAGAAQGEADRQAALLIAKRRQASEEAETQMRLALQQQELQKQLGAGAAMAGIAGLMNGQPQQPVGVRSLGGLSTAGAAVSNGNAPFSPTGSGITPDFMHVPSGIEDGTMGSAHPDRAQKESDALIQYHGWQWQQALPFIEKLPAEDKRVAVQALRDQQMLVTSQWHNNRMSAIAHDLVVGGAADPTDPATGQRMPDEGIRQAALGLADRIKAGDPEAQKHLDELIQRATEQHVAIGHRVAFGTAAQKQLDEKATKDPSSVSDRARMLADQVKAGTISPEYFNAEWPAAIASTKTNIVPGPEALKQITVQAAQERAQAATETAQARLENAQSRLEIAKMKAETDKTNAEFSNALKQAQANLEAAKTSYQNTLNDLAGKGQKPSGVRQGDERQSVYNELLKANPQLGNQDEETQNAAVERAMRVRSGQPPPPAKPEEPGFFSRMFTPSAKQSDVGLGEAGGGSSLEQFLKQWRADNPNGTKEEAQAAWSKLKK